MNEELVKLLNGISWAMTESMRHYPNATNWRSMQSEIKTAIAALTAQQSPSESTKQPAPQS